MEKYGKEQNELMHIMSLVHKKDNRKMLTTLNKYCSRCDIETPEYRASYRTDMFAPHWSTPNGEEWLQDICHECRGHLEDMADDGVIWSLVYQRRFTTTKCHYERVGQ